jgi:hypothetical protein
MAKAGKTKDLEKLSDEEILNMRVRDLGMQIQGSELQPLISRLYEELDAKGICFHPPCYLTDEWLCPDKVPIIGIPFYLAHPRLKQIEKKMMYEVEGGTEESCMKLLRHECGHALNYAFELYKKTRWRELFGSFSTRYSDSYYFRPYSRRYVINLQDNYAQSHPDEDFAETFAVWLAPGSNWEQKYRNWPVIKKLRYVDGLMKRISSRTPVKMVHGQPPWSASRMTSTLAAHYERKRRTLGSEFQGFYDDSLITLFSSRQSSIANLKASKFLRQHRRELVDSVARWTGHRKHDIHQLVNTLILRCDALNLYARTNHMEDIVGVTSLVTAIASNTLRIVGRHIR